MESTTETASERKARNDAAKMKITKISSVGNAPAKKAPKAPKNPVLCLCGCGSLCKSLFRQGHDARAKGMLIRHMAANNGTLSGFVTGDGNEGLVAYATGGGFSGRFLGVATNTKAPRAPRKAKAA